MIDTLILLAQGACLAGYLYGGWLCITHAISPREPGGARTPAPLPVAAAEWARRLSYDG